MNRTSGRRVESAVGVVVNGLILLGIHVWPGWAVLPFVTHEMDSVLPAIDLTLLVGIVAGVVGMVTGHPLARRVGEVVTIATGLAATIRLLRVFPFDFGASGFDWASLVRALLVLGIVGGSIGLIVAIARLCRLLACGRARLDGTGRT